MYKSRSIDDISRSNSRGKDRKSIRNQPCRKLKKGSCAISISSGKGGVGKTVTTVKMALAAAKMGYKVLVFDGDLGLANVDIVLGLHATHSLSDVLENRVRMKDIILTGPGGINVIPSGSGITELFELSAEEKQVIAEQIRLLRSRFDLLLVDTGAGIGPNVLHLNSIAQKRIIMTTPEPHAITDAYALIKVLWEQKGLNDFDLVVNMASSEQEAESVASRVVGACLRFMQVNLNYLGHIPHDESVIRSVLSQDSEPEKSLQSLSGQAVRRIISQSIFDLSENALSEKNVNFWEELVNTSDSEPLSFCS